MPDLLPLNLTLFFCWFMQGTSQTLVTSLDTGQLNAAIPRDFLGLSREWGSLYHMVSHMYLKDAGTLGAITEP